MNTAKDILTIKELLINIGNKFEDTRSNEITMQINKQYNEVLKMTNTLKGKLLSLKQINSILTKQNNTHKLIRYGNTQIMENNITCKKLIHQNYDHNKNEINSSFSFETTNENNYFTKKTIQISI